MLEVTRYLTLLFFQLTWQLTCDWSPTRHRRPPTTPFLMTASIGQKSPNPNCLNSVTK